MRIVGQHWIACFRFCSGNSPVIGTNPIVVFQFWANIRWNGIVGRIGPTQRGRYFWQRKRLKIPCSIFWNDGFLIGHKLGKQLIADRFPKFLHSEAKRLIIGTSRKSVGHSFQKKSGIFWFPGFRLIIQHFKLNRELAYRPVFDGLIDTFCVRKQYISCERIFHHQLATETSGLRQTETSLKLVQLQCFVAHHFGESTRNGQVLKIHLPEPVLSRDEALPEKQISLRNGRNMGNQILIQFNGNLTIPSFQRVGSGFLVFLKRNLPGAFKRT